MQNIFSGGRAQRRRRHGNDENSFAIADKEFNFISFGMIFRRRMIFDGNTHVTGNKVFRWKVLREDDARK